jgi:cell wall-associated NlpC family hydrolase
MSPSLYQRAGVYVGVPYKLHGLDPTGWDCRGCVGWLRREILGQPTPFWGDAYPLSGLVGRAYFEAIADLILHRLCAWRTVEAAPGVVVLFSVFKRPAHVGLMLDARNFIHAERGPDTSIARIDDSRWKGRVEGFYDI